jgi:hypothetical protein
LKLSKPTKLNETLQLLANFYKKRFNHSWINNLSH